MRQTDEMWKERKKAFVFWMKSNKQTGTSRNVNEHFWLKYIDKQAAMAGRQASRRAIKFNRATEHNREQTFIELQWKHKFSEETIWN